MSALADPGAETLYGDADQLALNFARLRVGHSLVFARGPRINWQGAVGRLVQGWIDAGKGRYHLGGQDGEGRRRHVVVRLDPAAGQANDERPRSSAASDRAEGLRVRLEAAGFEGQALTDAARLIELITEAARAGKRCPSGAEIAEALNLRDRERAAYLLRRLNRAGIIEMWSRDRGPRVVRIVGTRFETANVYGRRPDGLGEQIRKAFK